ncbi:MAG: hypothetical protein EOO40_09575, partial [Deltaproteobacteria bacterium]
MNFPDKDQPLRLDVGMLGALLGDVLREQGGEALFARVEQVRHLAQQHRDLLQEQDAPLKRFLQDLSPPEMLEVVHAFSAY